MEAGSKLCSVKALLRGLLPLDYKIGVEFLAKMKGIVNDPDLLLKIKKVKVLAKTLWRRTGSG